MDSFCITYKGTIMHYLIMDHILIANEDDFHRQLGSSSRWWCGRTTKDLPKFLSFLVQKRN